MSKLDELIAELCPDGVEYKLLGDLEKDSILELGRGKVISKKTISDNPGKYPVYSSSAIGEGLMGKYNQYMFDEVLLSWSIDGGGRFFYRNKHKFSLTNVSGWLRVLRKDVLNIRYLYYVMDSLWLGKTYDYVNKAHPSVIKNDYLIPLPPLPVQQEIVRILDTFTELIKELNAELEARKKQYEYYRDFLLTFGDEVPMMALGDICTVQSGGTPSKANHEYWDNGTIKWLGSTVCQNQKTVDEVTSYISELGLKNSSSKLMKKETTLIALVGATIGKVAFLPFEAAINQNIAGIYPIDTSRINPSYVFYACSMLYSDFIGLSQGKLAMANLSFVRGLKIPVPPLKEQERIVAILDRFDALCNDLTSGLPAEIEARQKQYEYYRDKLLSFKEVTA